MGLELERAPRRTGRPRDSRFSASLEQGVAVLLLFTDAAPAWGIAEMAAALKMSRSTVHRYARTWVRLGQLTQEGVAGRKYRRVIADA